MADTLIGVVCFTVALLGGFILVLGRPMKSWVHANQQLAMFLVVLFATICGFVGEYILA
jgi:hypothetical protein